MNTQPTQASGPLAWDTQECLTARTRSGMLVQGCDLVQAVPQRRGSTILLSKHPDPILRIAAIPPRDGSLL